MHAQRGLVLCLTSALSVKRTFLLFYVPYVFLRVLKGAKRLREKTKRQKKAIRRSHA